MRFSNENTILHQISKDPLSDKQMELIMYALQQNDVRPDAKNNDGKTFLNLSSIFFFDLLNIVIWKNSSKHLR